MKRYRIEVMGVDIWVRVIPQGHQKIINIQYNKDDEQEIFIPNSLFKKQFTSNAFARHILNFFIKE